jgi:N-acylneuraminate cytidylyltransferase
MIGNYNVLAIIPARGGSQRIPHKNMKLLCGQPLILYTIDQAKASHYIDRSVVVTDDEEIGIYAKSQGIDWPFKEPENLADGTLPDFAFFSYTLKWLKEHENYEPDIIVQLRPTSPLRTTHHINMAIELLVAHPKADSVRTVTEPEQSPYKMYSITANGFLEPLLTIPDIAESYNLPQQNLPKSFKHVGYVDVIWRRTMEQGNMTGMAALPLILEKAYSGINTSEDWDWYEYLMAQKGKI